MQLKIKQQKNKRDLPGYILDYQSVSDFCKIAEKVVKDSQLYLCSDGKRFSMFTQCSIAAIQVSYDLDPSDGIPFQFQCGISLSDFIILFKKLHSESPILLEIAKNCVWISEDNIRVKFMQTDVESAMTFPDFQSIVGGEKDWLVNSISCVYEAVGKVLRFPGILIDSDFDNITRVVNLSEYVSRSMVGKKITVLPKRMVVPEEMAKVLGVFKNINQVLFAKNHFGITLDNGIFFCTPLYQDYYPIDYMMCEQILNEVCQVDQTLVRNTFNREHFLAALDLVGAISGSEAFITCEIGKMSGRGHSVWELRARAYNGTSASESVECLESSEVYTDVFRFLKTFAIKGVKLHDETLYCYNTKAFLIFANENGSDITMLRKSSI